MHLLRSRTLLLTLLLSIAALGQSGMEALQKNDFFEARKRFSDKLLTDSTDYESLTGMVMLAEFSQEYIPYEKYLNTLMRHHRDAYTFALYNFLFTGNYEQVKQMNYPDWVTLKYQLNEVIKWGGTHRDRDKQWEQFRAIIPKMNWSMMGPFKNLNGSGWKLTHPIETEPYRNSAEYPGSNGKPLSWCNPIHAAASGRIVFSQHLPSMGWSDDAVYYANTFIRLPEQQKVQIHIGRTAPVKIWVNQTLVFESDHSVPFYYDFEILELTLNKGVNRILVKNATCKNTDESSGSLYFWDGNTYEHDMLALRFTDTSGKALTNYTSAFTDDSPLLPVEPGSITSTHSLVQHFKNKTAQSGSLWDEFCLLKSFISENYIREGEAHFYQKYRANAGSVFYGYLLAKISQFNGKSEKVYELLSKSDNQKTPFMGLMYEKLQEINLDTDPDAYYRFLEQLIKVSPSNYNVLNGFVSYFNKTGKGVEKDSFILQSIRKYPRFEEDLKPMLSTYKEEEERFGPAEQLKAQKASIKALKTGSDESDINYAIEYYKDRKKKDKVVALYKDKIYFSPHFASNYNEFAAYLKEIERYEEAKEVLQTSLKINPYQSAAYEMLGDLAKLQGYLDQALYYYRTGLKLGSDGVEMFGYGNGLEEKIEQIVGNDNNKRIFTTPGFSQTLEDPEWLKKAENEDAIVLQYTKDIALDTNNKVDLYQTLMIKILRESGIEKYNEMDLSFMGNISSARIIKDDGSVYNPERSGGYLVIKNLTAGDLIQVEGHETTEAQTLFGAEFYHQHFVFFPDPVFYSKFDLAVPRNKKITYKTHKIQPEPTFISDSSGFDHYIWENHNLDKIQDEAAFPDYYDYYRSISVSTMQSWEPINDWYEQTTYKKTDLTYEVKEIMDSIIQAGMSDSIKVQTIYNYITAKIRYSYVAFLNSRFVPKWPGNTCSAGIGDCKDVATLMITMLRAQGIESYYTLVKTGQFNHLEPVPSLSFDHVIVCYLLNGKKHYCDLTTNFYPLNVLPEMDNNAVALLIRPGVKDIFHLPNDMLDEGKTGSVYEIEAELVNGRDLKLTGKGTYTGTAGGNLREQIFRTPQSKYGDFISQYFGQDVFENSNYESVSFDEADNFNKPLIGNYQLTSKGFADRVSGLYIVRMPYLEAIRKNPAISESNRTNRVDLQKILNVQPSLQKIRFKIPEGYKLAEMPKDLYHKSFFSYYHVSFSMSKNELLITKRQVFYKNMIEIGDFQAFKEDYLQLLDLDKFKIALVKK